MEIEVVKYPASVLLTKSQDIVDFGDSLKSLIVDLEDSLEKYNGSGISAIQIGVNKNIFLAKPVKNEKSMIFINPKIIEYGTECDLYEEGCLSFPGVYINIKRPTTLKIRYQDETGTEKEYDAKGFAARVIQHEYDHLQGKMFFENVSKIRQKFVIKEFEKLERTKAN